MGIKKAIVLGSAALVINAAEAKPSNLPDITENTRKEVKENIAKDQIAKKAGEKSITREEAIAGPGEGEVDKIIQMRETVDTNIRDVEVDKKLKYLEFKYKENFKIKYEPQPIKGESGSDKIYVTDSITHQTYEFEIGQSLFNDDLKPKDRKIETQQEKLKKRLDRIMKAHTIINEYIKSDTTLVANPDEPVCIKGKKIYFGAERKTLTKKGEEDYKETFFMIQYQDAKTEGETIIPEKFTTKEMKKDSYYEEAYI